MSQPDYPAYHAAAENHGNAFTFDSGGFYEAVEDNVPQQRLIAGEFAGWQYSDVPELSASASPESAVFAKCQRAAEGPGNTAQVPVRIWVYGLTREPDVDLRNTVAGDFAFLEEVRYRNVDEHPVEGELVHEVTFPARVRGDVDLAYLPDGPYIIESWAEAVKDAIRAVIENGAEYPEDVSEWGDVPTPNIEAYSSHLSPKPRSNQ